MRVSIKLNRIQFWILNEYHRPAIKRSIELYEIFMQCHCIFAVMLGRREFDESKWISVRQPVELKVSLEKLTGKVMKFSWRDKSLNNVFRNFRWCSISSSIIYVAVILSVSTELLCQCFGKSWSLTSSLIPINLITRTTMKVTNFLPAT